MNNPLQHVTKREISPANHIHKDVDLCLPKQAGHQAGHCVGIIITTMIIFNRLKIQVQKPKTKNSAPIHKSVIEMPDPPAL
jgi:hypothetical protein